MTRSNPVAFAELKRLLNSLGFNLVGRSGRSGRGLLDGTRSPAGRHQRASQETRAVT
jgi:hypothetical protein